MITIFLGGIIFHAVPGSVVNNLSKLMKDDPEDLNKINVK
jgi:hypothetical protein